MHFLILKIYRCHARIKVDPKNKNCELLEIHNHLPMIEIGSADSIDVTDKIELKETKRGGNYYILDGRKFVKCAQKGVTERFRCTLYTQHCKCRLLIYDGKILLSNKHNHN